MVSRYGFDVVGVGALNVDRIHRVSRLTLDGLEWIAGVTVDAGGSSANTIYALARLGLRCGFLGTVGDDPEAEIVLGSFRQAGVNTGGIVRRPLVRTGSILVISDSGGQRAMYLEPGANALFIAEDIPVGYLSGVRLLHVSSFCGSIPADLQRALVEALPPEALLAVTLDGQLAQQGWEAIAPLLHRCQVLLGNRQEIEEITRDQGPQRLLAAGCRTVVMTLGPGEDGVACRIFSPEEEVKVPAKPTLEAPIADATGAGDAFAAGYLWGMLAGWPPSRCGSLGHTLAGFVLEAPGCRAGVPETERLFIRHRRFFGDGPPAL